jgi:diaminopimelate epimerase
LKFTKMHGIGNDFVVVNMLDENIPEESLSKASVKLCDRNFGVGGDGLILVCASDVADLRMRMLNPDGSEAEMCGNGIRCFAKYAYEHGVTDANSMTVETLAGIQKIDLVIQDGKVSGVTVDMGAPILERGDIPMTGDAGRVIDEPLSVDGRVLNVTCVSMGNPHCVSFVENVDEFPLREVGPLVERHKAFPRRTNVEFVQVLNSGEVKMRVWERGASETLACGTGACATAVASILNQKTGNDVLVHLAGGDLRIQWDGKGSVFMTGPAEEVFNGEIEDELWKSWING